MAVWRRITAARDCTETVFQHKIQDIYFLNVSPSYTRQQGFERILFVGLNANENLVEKQVFTIETKSAQATQKLGEKLGRLLHGQALVTLEGDLGCGKTTFSQGLARGLAVPEGYYVTSPSFAIINEYPARLPFYHMDFYRLNDAGELEDLGFFDILREDSVIAIEWAAKFPEVFNNLPHLEIKFSYIDTNLREISLIAYGQAYENLIQDLVR